MRNFIIGTDWWTDCDDAVALRVLARAHKAGDIRIKGIILNACMEYSVASLDGFLHTEGVSDIPIGIDPDATDFGGEPPYQKSLSRYAVRYQSNSDAEDAVRLYRKILAEATAPLEMIEIGFLQVVSALIESGPDDISAKSGTELMQENVSAIWVMAGKWDENPGEENNFARNARARKAAAVFCEKCPVPITFLGWEIGFDVISGDCLGKDDVLYRVLCEHGSPEGRMSWDPMLALLALTGNCGQAGYDTVRGNASVDPETGLNYFAKSAHGRHCYVVKNKDNAFYKAGINERISTL